MNDRDILTGSRSWSATPWVYSSMVYFQFAEDDTGVALYGYGQTIYAKLDFTFELFENCRIRLTYLDSPPYLKFAGFVPSDENRHSDLVYSLIDDQRVITESITAFDFRFEWQLEFSASPFPDGINFPHDVPLIYFGYRERMSDKNAT